jgi:hypothetical protein
MRNLLIVAMMLGFTQLAVLAQASDLSGRWKGTWTTFSQGEKRPHHGTLRVHLRPRGDGTYQGTFAGRFAIVIPYFYRATVTQYGNTVVSTKRLGPFGEYRMHLHHQPGSLNGHWSAGSEAGSIRLMAR